MMFLSYAVLLFTACISVQPSHGTLTSLVYINQGKLRGLRILGYNRYLSIPYATSERFQLPKEPVKWDGVFHAVNPLVRCPQLLSFLTTGTEDCLYLDVYTPEKARKGDNLPVMVFFHGGAYFKGSKELYDPHYLVTKGTVVVTINYRLGVLGFLCLNGISNLGLRDQVAALQWIRKNIASFGGNPDNVTLCGQSAGASSVALHFLSELSKDLFHKAILMSGTALSTWAFNVEPFKPALDDARKISPARTERDVYNIFVQAPLPTLLHVTYDNSVNPRYFKYSPCVDNNFTQPFFRDTPYNILKSGQFNKVPTIIGYTDNEGGFFYRLLSDTSTKELNDNFNNMLPCVFSWCSDKKKREIGKIMRSHYFGNSTIDYRKSAENLTYFYADWIAYGSISAFSKILTRFSDRSIYNYQFSYVGARNFGKALSGLYFNGTTHAGELFYVFQPLGISLPLISSDRKMVDRITTLIYNFMLRGNPTPKTNKLLPLRWPAATTNQSNILVLDKHLYVIDHPREEQRGDFFLKLLCTYGKSGYVPCDSAERCS